MKEKPTILPTILIVADNEANRAALAVNFSASERYESVIQAQNAPSALAEMRQTPVSAIVIDGNEHDRQARDCASALRNAGVDLPMVRLVETEASAPEAADLGWAVVKPARLSEIVTHLEQRSPPPERGEGSSVKIGAFLYVQQDNVIYGSTPNDPIRLTEKESALLGYLYKNGNRIVCREEILRNVWGYDSGITTHTLETYIYRLRQKLGAEDVDSTPLLTVPGGYLLQISGETNVTSVD